MDCAVGLIGTNVFPLQQRIIQVAGGEYFPSGKKRIMSAPHCMHLKVICITSGLTVLTFTAVPRTDTSLSTITYPDTSNQFLSS